MPTLKQRVQRLEQQAGTHQALLDLSDEVWAQSASELTKWRDEQTAAIVAWKAQSPADRSHVGHEADASF